MIATAAATSGTAAARTRIAARRDTGVNASQARRTASDECLHFRGGSSTRTSDSRAPNGAYSAPQSAGSAALRLLPRRMEREGVQPMRKHTPGRLLAYGLSVVAVAALAIAGAASGNHWADYNGTADTHELVDGNPPLCPATAGGVSFRVDASELTEGGEYPSGNPLVKITALDKSTAARSSWALLPTPLRHVRRRGGRDEGRRRRDGLPLRRERRRNRRLRRRGSRRRSTRTASRAASVRHQPRRLLLRPEGRHGRRAPRGHEDGAGVVGEGLHVGRREVRRPVAPRAEDGQTGTANWKVDVTQTGFAARNAVVSGTITVTNPNDEDVTGRDRRATRFRARSWTATASADTGLTVPANGSIECTYTAARDSVDGGTNTATATATLDGVDVSDSGTADFTFGDPTVEINKTVKAVDGKNTWNGITGTTSFPYSEQFGCSSTGRTNVVNLLGDNPATPEVETDYLLDTDSATVTVHCSTTPPVTPPVTPPTDEFMDVQVAKDATPQVQLVNGQADRLVHRAGEEQRPEPGAQRHGRRRGAERRHVPGRHPAARERRLLDHRRRPAAVQPGHARPRCRACDRRLGPRHADRDVRQLRDGHRRRQGHERREQQGVRLDARHRSGDAAGRDAQAEADQADTRSRSPRRTSAACSR